MSLLRALCRLVVALCGLAYVGASLFVAGIREALRREPGNVNSGADRP